MKNLWISIKITLAMCVVLFVGYVLVLRLVAWVASPNDGEAPVVTYNGKVSSSYMWYPSIDLPDPFTPSSASVSTNTGL